MLLAIKISVVIVLFLILIYLAILLHELGHLFYGILHGFKFRMICVGPIGVREVNGRCKLYFEPNINYWGGISLSSPQEEKESDMKVYTNMIIAGPIISAFTFFLSALVGLMIKNFILLMFALLCLGIFISTAIPLETELFYTDGYRYKILKKNDNRAKEEYSVIRINFNIAINKCYKYINTDDLTILRNSKNNKNKYLGMLYSFKYFEEVGEKSDIFLHELKKARENVPIKYVKMLEG